MATPLLPSEVVFLIGNLTEEQALQFTETYEMHNLFLPISERVRFSAHNIIDVKPGEDDCIVIQYKCGTIIHYTPERTWYY